MKNFEKFQMANLAALQSILKREIRVKNHKIVKIPKSNLSPQEKRVIDLFYACSAITAALDNMKKSIRYIEVSSKRPPEINREEHIQYHYENFLQSAYILKEKLSHIIPQIYKLEGKWVTQEGRDLNKSVRKQLQDIFKSMSEIRGAHVHQPKGYFDEELSNARMYSLLNKYNQDEFKRLYMLTLWLLKSGKIVEMKKLLKGCEKTSDSLFEELCKKFLKGSKLQLPK